MNRCPFPFERGCRRLAALLGAVLGSALISGCATTAPATYRTPARVAQLVPAPAATWIAPVDVELAELTASGAVEPRADWTDAARERLVAALQQRTGFQLYPVEEQADPELLQEIKDAAALARAMNLTQISTRLPTAAGPVPPSAATHGFDYQVGRLTAHAEKLGEGAVLVVYLRDSYATGGRKALAALGIVSAAFTGVYIAPTMGQTVATAALIDHEGHVLWLNQSVVAKDLRDEAGITQLLDDLLQGLPSAPSAGS